MNIADRSPRRSGLPRAETAGPLGRPENASLRRRRPDDVPGAASAPETAGETPKRAFLGHFAEESFSPGTCEAVSGYRT